MKSNSVEASILASASERYTNTRILPSTIFAFVAGSLTVAFSYLLAGIVPYFFSLINQRGIIQYLTIYCFWFAIGMLIFKFKALKRERSAFDLPFIKKFTADRQVVSDKTLIAQHMAIEENAEPHQMNLLLINRINKGIKQLKINNSPAEVADVLATVSETDSAIIDSSYILIKYMIWVIPVLGFIGTIIGMTQSIGSFDAVLKGIKETGFSGVQESLGLVTAGLAVAFDTTFLALLLSATINLGSNMIQKQEEDFLSDVDDFIVENIINKLSILKSQMPSDLPPVRQPVPVAETSSSLSDSIESLTREIKNMNRQNQVNADELQTQIGRVIEAIEKINRQGQGEAPQIANEDMQHALKAMGNIGQFMQKNLEVLEKLPESIEELSRLNKKLGELYGKIYKTEF